MRGLNTLPSGVVINNTAINNAKDNASTILCFVGIGVIVLQN